MQKKCVYNTLRMSLFFSLLCFNLQLREKKYDFHNYIVVQIHNCFNVKHCKGRKKRKIFLALNFRLAVNILQLIYALKKHNN
jgi:hypothetical protein